MILKGGDNSNEVENSEESKVPEGEDGETGEGDIKEETVGGIGGGEDLTYDLIKQNSPEAVVQLSQMELDANKIRQEHSFILPLKGTITSRFGAREPSSIVSANHAGIDIGANEGTVFVASMSGKVILASSEGTFGKHLFIQDGNVVTVYAHCNKLYVNQGDTVVQGQYIGEVGQTGNATGPHLHFEIRCEDRKVNPELVLQF